MNMIWRICQSFTSRICSLFSFYWCLFIWGCSGWQSTFVSKYLLLHMLTISWFGPMY